MNEKKKIPILIYHKSVELTFWAHDQESYLKMKNFLNGLEGKTSQKETLSPAQGQLRDFYILDDQQFKKFSAFLQENESSIA